jgi:hypothetical protein
MLRDGVGQAVQALWVSFSREVTGTKCISKPLLA